MSAPARSSKERYSTKERLRTPGTTQTLIETTKALHALVATVMAEQAALRRTILEHPAFAVSYENHLKTAADTARPLLAEALESYDVLLENADSLEN
jgi:hypothetical protein